jgi:DNA-binding beta-propeller fold protein YncE
MSKSGPGNTAPLFTENAPSLTQPGHFPVWHRNARRLLAVAVCWAAPVLFGQTYKYYTIAGIGGAGGSVDGSGGSAGAPALFNHPTGVVVDASGNLYVADANNDTIRKVTSAGVVSTFAGTAGVPGSANGTGSGAFFNLPQGVAIDSTGNIYVADYKNSTIRKVTSAAVVTTIAGTAGVAGAADGAAAVTTLNSPLGVAVDGSGNVYVADTGNHTIRKVTSSGTVSTLAGIAGTSGKVNGAGTVATFNGPSGVAVDSSGNVYVADTYNHAIRMVTSAGVVTTFAGTLGVAGTADGAAASAGFNFPSGVAVDSAGNVYVADQGNNTIRKISAGIVSTVAGPVATPYLTGRVDGPATTARFNHPTGLAVDSSGNVYVADYDNDLIRKVSAQGVVSTLAGAGGIAGSLDGTGSLLFPSEFWRPTNLAMDSANNIYVSDTFNDSIRKISAAGVVTTLAGKSDVTGGTAGSADGIGTAATFNGPSGMAADGAGNVYVADTYNHTIRMITPAGVVTTLAGTAGTAGSTDGTGDNGTTIGTATFNLPSGVAVSPDNSTLYVADYGNDTIRAINLAGRTVTTFAGTAGVSGSTNGNGTGASFDHPRDLVTDSSGNIYVADVGNQVIRKITPGGQVSLLAGTVGVSGSTDGTGTAAKFNGPTGVAVDPTTGNVLVADSNSSTIRMITPAGVVTTVGGTAGMNGNLDGIGAAAKFDHPTGIAVDSGGNLFIADNDNNTIREGVSPNNTGGPIGTGSGGTGGGSNGGIGGGTDVSTTGINGTGTFLHPGGIVRDPVGNVYVADTAHHCIEKITSSGGGVVVFAGKSGTAGTADGVGGAATFNSPTGIAIGTGNTLYVTDTGNGTIRRILTDGTVSTLAGSTSTRGSADGTGTAATFNSPTGIAVSLLSGNIFVADSANATIRMVTPAGVVTTVAGTAGQLGEADGQGTAARFNNPTGIGVDALDNVYIADTYNDTVRMMSPTFAVTTLAGSAGVSGSYDGAGGYALFNLPQGIAVIPLVAVYVADTGNNTIRSISLGGSATVETLAGFSGISGARDGVGNAALFNQPTAMYYYAGGAGLDVADTGNALIRFVYIGSSAVTTPLFTTSTSGGTTGGTTGSSGGGAMEAWFAVTLLGLGGARFWSDRNSRRL